MTQVNESHVGAYPSNAWVCGASYVLGEITENWEAIPDLDESLARAGMMSEPDLWGWGQYRRTRRAPVDLAVESARRTLSLTGTSASRIDAVLMCSAVFPTGVSAHREMTHRFLSSLGMEATPLLGITLSRCATLVCGMRLADDLIASERYRTILLVSFDAVPNERERFESFAIFSDGAASCLLTREPMPGYRLVCSVQASQATAQSSDGPDAGGKLAARANVQLKAHQLLPRDLSKVFHDNLFLPIVSIREQMAGFSRDQLYTENIARVGHCFGCDPLINLSDYAASTGISDHTLVGMFSGTPGVRSGLVLQASGASHMAGPRQTASLHEPSTPALANRREAGGDTHRSHH